MRSLCWSAMFVTNLLIDGMEWEELNSFSETEPDKIITLLHRAVHLSDQIIYLF